MPKPDFWLGSRFSIPQEGHTLIVLALLHMLYVKKTLRKHDLYIKSTFSSANMAGLATDTKCQFFISYCFTFGSFRVECFILYLLRPKKKAHPLSHRPTV